MRTGKCKLCEILKDPQKHFDQILYEDTNCIIGSKEGQNVICIYNKHSDNPGGKIINKMTEVLLKLKRPSEKIEYLDHKHFHCRLIKKGDKDVRNNT